MKNSTAPNRKTGRMIAKNLIVLFTVAVAGFCGIQAWFTDKQTVEADGINVKCQIPDGIEVAVVKHGAAAPTDEQYTDETILLDKDHYQFVDDIKMTEVSSDGYTFYKPALTQKDGVATPILDADWEDADSAVHYLSFDLYVRSTAKFDIYIDKDSQIRPNAEVLTGENADNKSDFGESGDSKDISRDCVTGAVRFSVANYNTQETKLLWIPAPNILLNVNKNDTTKYSVSTGERSGVSYSHSYFKNVSGNWVENSVSVNDGSVLGQVFVANNNGFTSDGEYTYKLGVKKKIMTLEKSTQDGKYTGMVTCNMWVDGQDAEARLALVNGKFKANLVISKSDAQ